MKILVLSASPKNENSITYHVGKFMEKVSSVSVKDEFEFVFIGNGEYTKELGEKILAADIVMFCSSLFHFSIPTQTIRFLNSMQADLGDKVKNKPVTYFTTSSQLMDISAHSYMKKKLLRIGVKYMRSLSLLDEAILHPEGREEVANWYRYIRSVAQNTNENFKDNNCRIAILDATDGNNAKLNSKMEKVQNILKERGIGEIEIFKLREYDIKPCIACSSCYTSNECFIKDQNRELDEKIYKNTDIIMTFGELEDGLLGPYHKIWLDRHVSYGLRPMENEVVFSYMVDTAKAHPDDLLQLKVHSMAIDNFNGDYYAGVCDVDDESAVDAYCEDLVKIYNYELYPQSNYLMRGTRTMFSKIGWILQNMNVNDYAWYKKNGYYDKIPVNPNIGPVHSFEDSLKTNKMRTNQYKFAIDAVKEDPALKTRRRANNRWNKPATDIDKYEEQGFLQKLFAKFKKK